MPQSPFNVLATPRPEQPRRPPLLLILATVGGLLVLGQDIRHSRETLASLRYAALGGPAESHAVEPAEHADIAQISAQLTYPWDRVLNRPLLPQGEIELLAYTASHDDSPNQMRVQAPDLDSFWRWLAQFKQAPDIQQVTAVNVAVTEQRPVFDVAIHWRRP